MDYTFCTWMPRRKKIQTLSTDLAESKQKDSTELVGKSCWVQQIDLQSKWIQRDKSICKSTSKFGNGIQSSWLEQHFMQEDRPAINTQYSEYYRRIARGPVTHYKEEAWQNKVFQHNSCVQLFLFSARINTAEKWSNYTEMWNCIRWTHILILLQTILQITLHNTNIFTGYPSFLSKTFFF